MKRKRMIVCTAAVLVLTMLYLLFAYSPVPFVAHWRQVYIETAMGTMNHRWLAERLLPKSVVETAMSEYKQRTLAQTGLRSHWPQKPADFSPPVTDRASFFTVFDQLDPSLTTVWLQTRPDLLQDGWNNLRCFDRNGLGLQTIHGDPVLGIDAPNGILLIEARADAASGVLAICEYPARLSIASTAYPGTAGQSAGEIGRAAGAVLSMTCSAFHHANDGGNGAELAGFAMCGGTPYGSTHLPDGNKRVELRTDNLLYLCDSGDPVDASCTDAAEFRPALIVDGETVVTDDWSGLQPRVCLGQTTKGEILMLAVEGRIPSKGILGASLTVCAGLLARYDACQAINLDGGNSAMLWYEGEYLIQCSDGNFPQGRPLPNAVVYGR